jgi:hypothetical protein
MNQNLKDIFRKLWEQHIMWTRSYIISTAANLGDLQPVTRRLLQNPGDFANELRKYYGDNKAKEFANLLTEHLLIAARLVNDAKMQDTQAVEADEKKWYENADAIADFLAGINPYWNKQEWRNMLHEHLRLTENEAVYRLSGQFASDVGLYDSIENSALKMADYMAEGIEKQFHL